MDGPDVVPCVPAVEEFDLWELRRQQRLYSRDFAERVEEPVDRYAEQG